MSGLDWSKSWVYPKNEAAEEVEEEPEEQEEPGRRKRLSKKQREPWGQDDWRSRYESTFPRWRQVRALFDPLVDYKDDLGRLYVILDAPTKPERRELAGLLRQFLNTEDLRVALVVLPIFSELKGEIEGIFFPEPGEEVVFKGARWMIGNQIDRRPHYGVFGVSLNPH